MKRLTFRQEYVRGPLLSGRSAGVKGGRGSSDKRGLLSSFHPELHTPSREEQCNKQRDALLHDPNRLLSLLLAQEGVPAEPSSLRLMQSSSLKTDKQHFVSFLLANRKLYTLAHPALGPQGSLYRTHREGAKADEYRYSAWNTVWTVMLVLVCFHVISEKTVLRN